MDIATTSLLANQLQTLDPKTNSKEALTQQANEIIQKTKDLPLELSAQKTLNTHTPVDAKDVVSQLLNSAISEAKSKSAIYEVLQNHPLFKNMGNFAEDIKSLTSMIKMDSSMAQPLALLQLFSKNISQIDTQLLQTQIQNSGVFFESKLANIVTQKGVSDVLDMLNTQIKNHFATSTPQTESIVKELNTLLDHLNTLQELSSKEAQSTLKNLLDVFRQGVKQELASAQSPLHEVYQTVQKLEYAVKQMDLIASKAQNYPPSMQVEANFTQQVKVYLEQLKGNLGALQLEDLTQQIDQLLSKESLLKAQGVSMPIESQSAVQKTPVASLKADGEIPIPLDKATLSSTHGTEESTTVQNNATTNVLNAMNTVLATSSVPSSSQIPQSVEEALKMVANRIQQQVDMLDPKMTQRADFNMQSAVLDKAIHSLIKPELFVGKAMSEKLALNPNDVELLSDIKGVLTKLNETLSTSAPNKEAYEVTNRLLTQIEYHQLFSYVSSATHLYIPFSWEGMKSGSMMMKQSGTKNFHCQIDLDLEHYGKLNMMLILSNDKYIDMSVAAQKKELKDKMNQQLPKLKQAFNEVGLVTGQIKMLEYKEVSTVKNDYFSGEKLEFGINFKI